MNHRIFGRALLGASALALTAFAAPAAAQRVERIVAFGDSYADSGNAVRLGLVPAQLLPLYPTGRFTGGTNYVDTLSQLLNAPVQNFAIGGARANPDLLFEIGTFTAGGGGVFPVVTPSFGPRDLVTVSIGGNDARAYGSAPGASVAGAAAAAAPAVAAATSGLNTLVARGAPTISFLAGNTGELPEIAANPAAAAIRTAYSNAFNQGIQNVLAGYAANGVIVHYLDLSTMLAQVRANPSAYGISALNCPAFPNTSCVVNAGAGFLFYGDLLHPTSQGSAIIARYVAAQLAAPLTLQAPSDLGHDTARQFGRTLSSRVDLSAVRSGGEMLGGARLFVVGDGFSRDVGDSDDNKAFDVDGAGVTAGAEMGLAGGVAGLALNVSRPRVRFGDESSWLDGRSVQIGGYAGASFGGAFAQGHLGFGRDRHRIRRLGVVEGMSARANGNHLTAGVKGGYLVPLGGLNAGPVVALDLTRARTNGYSEGGDPTLALNVGRQRLRSVTGALGVEARPNLGAELRPFVSAMVERDFTGDGRSISFAQATSPGIVNRWDIAGAKETYGRLSGGGSATLFGGMSIDAAVSTTVGRDAGNEVSARVGLRFGF